MKWAGRIARSLEVLPEFSTRQQGNIAWEYFKLVEKEGALLTLYNMFELKQKRLKFMKKLHNG